MGEPADKHRRADRRLVAALLSGDERAFLELVDQLHPTLVRVARGYVPSLAVAEEVAQETWMAVLQGLARFEFRSSLNTWILSILLNLARRSGRRERRRGRPHLGPGEPDRVEAGNRSQAVAVSTSGQVLSPNGTTKTPEQRLLDREVREVAEGAIQALPTMQRTVIILRDVFGWTGTEVRVLLGISAVNQRVLLHRARASVRRALKAYLAAERSAESPAASETES